jgi:GH18 family chitinase
MPGAGAGPAPAQPVDVEFEIGWWNEGFGLAASSLRSLVKQVRSYVDHGHGATDRPVTLFSRSGAATIGLYIGQGLLNQAVSESPLKILHDNLETLDVSTNSLAMQLCSPGYDSTHIFGIMVTSNGTFAPIQTAVRNWANATCLSFSNSSTFAGTASFVTPLLLGNGTVAGANSTANTTVSARGLAPRAECRTIQVEAGDGCATLATKCGIFGADFTKYNPGSLFCSTLKPKQHVCCSSGDLPDFRPSPNPDGSCHAYTVLANDNCYNIGAEFSLTVDEIEEFNKNTWGWNGCRLLWLNTIMCLSEGTPPFPAEVSNAVCGPQKPGTVPPTDGSNIADLNPCPLNACCNIWGQCGLSTDFCIDTNTGAPGTAAPGTHGCISNCGMEIVKGTGTGAIKIGYFQGYNLGRECLYQDASQIDTARYSHIHFAFATLTPDFKVQVGDVYSQYQFEQFKRLSGSKRILSFGGWDFSNNWATYTIFRNGVKPANRLTMATNIANFIKEHGLDGVDIDWEYPGAPDLPDEEHAGEADEGLNYYYFLVVLKNLLRPLSVSLAAPSSYWYLKAFPIKDIGRVVDYIVFMTYDLHGQWDAGNRWSQEGCITGNCLRSQVNLTETRQALTLITKAGVPGHKVVVGVTSYGRSFEMAQPGCWGPDCTFTGDRLTSNAAKGRCTGTAGYISDAEIADIMADGSRVVTSFLDTRSHTDILVYDNNQWVGYMGSRAKQVRSTLYANLGLGGTTDWAVDLQQFHDVPDYSIPEDWPGFKLAISLGQRPEVDYSRTGNWTAYKCTHTYSSEKIKWTPSERWHGVNTDAAWGDVVRIWKESYKPRGDISFITAVSQTLLAQSQVNCSTFEGKYDNCDTPTNCPDSADGPNSGAAAEFIWNSLIFMHELHHDFYNDIGAVQADIAFALDDMENTFAPIPPPEDTSWFLIVLDLVTWGTLTVAAPLFNAAIRNKPWFSDKTWTEAKDAFLTGTGQSTTLMKDVGLDPTAHKWTPEAQDVFSHMMAQVFDGWRKIASVAVDRLFSGDDRSLEILWNCMSDGKLIEGRSPGGGSPFPGDTDVKFGIKKLFYGYSIPALWRVSDTYAFVVDSGFGCGEDKPLDAYLDDATMDATGACVDGRRYYLVHPAGDARVSKCTGYGPAGCTSWERVNNKFAAPVGLGALGRFGNLTKEDLVTGSVRTWLRNGRKNGGGGVPDEPTTFDDLVQVDVRKAGFVHLPVCSPERAFQSWDTGGRGATDNYPCDVPPGINHCQDTNFVDQTSAVSPLVADCLQIIRNIEGNGKTEWTHDVVGKPHREILKYGTCHFGIEATEVDGNSVFMVGGQDVIDIINEAVKRFGGGIGRVSGYGHMLCNGLIHQQWMKWGIY